MARVVLASVADASDSTFPAFDGVTATGTVESKAVLTQSGRPLILWQHVLAPHGEIHWDQPKLGQVIYVREGTAEANGQQLNKDGSLIVAHGAKAVLRAGASPVTLLHFLQPETASASRPAGGCVHVVNKKDAAHYAHPNTKGVVFANASCPTCQFWLHESQFFGATSVPRHAHTEDEVIFVLEGTMKLGKRQLTPGGALAIDADTVYTFDTGEDGLRFINFRASEPYVQLFTPEGMTPPESERQWMADHTVAAA